MCVTIQTETFCCSITTKKYKNLKSHILFCLSRKQMNKSKHYRSKYQNSRKKHLYTYQYKYIFHSHLIVHNKLFEYINVYISKLWIKKITTAPNTSLSFKAYKGLLPIFFLAISNSHAWSYSPLLLTPIKKTPLLDPSQKLLFLTRIK